MLKKFDDDIRLKNNFNLICGVDEAGRGPLAGPVVAAAVIMPPDKRIIGINDSKKLSEKVREKLYGEIICNCLSYGIGIVDEKKIDEINILQAALLAMKIAVDKLTLKPELIIIDGNKSFDTNTNVLTIVDGDAKSFSIAAASIIAKVTRDRIMRKYHLEYPVYNWIKNKGYGTKEHINQLLKHGKSKFHRESFIKNIFTQNKRDE